MTLDEFRSRWERRRDEYAFAWATCRDESNVGRQFLAARRRSMIQSLMLGRLEASSGTDTETGLANRDWHQTRGCWSRSLGERGTRVRLSQRKKGRAFYRTVWVTGRGKSIALLTDSGIGIQRDELPHVLERFFRGKSSHAMSAKGNGLGLPIAGWIVTQCAGTIELSLGGLGGTCARVSLPLDTPAGGHRRRNP